MKNNDYYNFWIKKNGISFLFDLESTDQKEQIGSDSDFRERLLNIFDNRKIGNIGTYLMNAYGQPFFDYFSHEIKVHFEYYKGTGMIPEPLK